MATYGKPTTSFYVNYGDLSPAAAQRALAPVLIAPRYKLHKLSDGDKARLMTYPETAENVEFYPWPGKDTDDLGIVDMNSVKVYAKNAQLKLNKTPLSGTVGADATNYILMANSIKTVSEAIKSDAALQGFDIQIGDYVSGVVQQVSDGVESTFTARVVDILPEYGETQVTVAPATANASVTAIDVDDESFTGSIDVAYLVSLTVSDGVTTADIVSLLGDVGYSKQIVLGSDYTTIGEYGIQIKRGTTAASTGDSFIVTGTPKKIESYNRVYISADLEAAGKPVSVDFSTDRFSSEFTEISSAYWDLVSSGVKVLPGITVPVAAIQLPMTAADLYVEYREQLHSDLLELYSSASADIQEWVGEVTPDNPMGMMYAAATASGNNFFYLIATENSEESTIQGVNYVAQFENVYAFVPYIQTYKTQAAISAAIAKYSAPTVAQFKRAWFCPVISPEAVIYDRNSDGSILVGSVNAEGILNIVGTSTDIIAAGVRSGDLVRFASGVELPVESILSKSTAKLRNTSAAVGLTTLEFVRKRSGSDFAEALAAEAAKINSSRINYVVSDELNFNGFANVSKAYLCAALASMRCSLAPHAPMNELVVPGFTISDKMKWSDTDYEVLNNGGAWVVAKNAEGDVVTYHQITTLTDGTIAEEDSVVSNGDEIVRRLRLAVKPYACGKSNVTDALIGKIRSTLVAELTQLQADYYPEIYGQRILNYTIDQLYVPEGNKRSLVCSLSISLPQPMQDGRFNFNLF